jgi:hypothetical protein
MVFVLYHIDMDLKDLYFKIVRGFKNILAQTQNSQQETPKLKFLEQFNMTRFNIHYL